MTAEVLTAALAAWDAGLCPIRPRTDGSKAPMAVVGRGKLDASGKLGAGWEAFQAERPKRETVEAWFGSHPGLGLVCGAVSGNLEMLELEGRAVEDGLHLELRRLVEEAGLGDLFDRITRGYSERTPSGGGHLLMRVTDGPAGPSMKLAHRSSTAEELAARPTQPLQVLIETKGEGGFVIVAPSNGTTHPTGGSWTLTAGGLDRVALVTVAERDALYEVCRKLDRVERDGDSGIAQVPPAGRAPRPEPYSGGPVGKSYVDVVEAHLAATDTMVDALVRYGWVDLRKLDAKGCPLFERPGQVEHPGRNGGLINASGRLVVVSTSTPFVSTLEKDRHSGRGPTYGLLDVWAAYEHRGDRMAAARAIAEETGILAVWRAEEAARERTMFGLDPTPPPGVDPGTGEVRADEGDDTDEGDEAQGERGGRRKLISTKGGLRALDALRAVLDLGPIRPGTDGQLWRYERGVYLPDGEPEARLRLRGLLGQGYRLAHRSTVTELLGTEPVFITDTPPEQWVNVTNGLLDWRTGELVPHSPEVATTYQLAVPWRPEATCPTVEAWLGQVVDPTVVPLVWEVVGMAVYAGQPFQRAVMLHGPGRNGKGTLLRLIERLVGTQHAAAVTLQALAEDRFAAADLYGRGVNLAGDLDAQVVRRTGLFKMLTGGDLVTAQRKYGQPFQFTNRALMIFSANDIPRSFDHSDGFHSRWVVVPFDQVQLGPDDEDETLEPRMHRELPGVLVRAVEGLRRAMARGHFDIPRVVADATAEYRASSDPIRRFADDVLDVDGDWDHHVLRSGVVAAYRQWAAGPMSEGHQPLGDRAFWSRLVAADDRIDTGVTADNPNGHRYGQDRIVRGIRGWRDDRYDRR